LHLAICNRTTWVSLIVAGLIGASGPQSAAATDDAEDGRDGSVCSIAELMAGARNDTDLPERVATYLEDTPGCESLSADDLEAIAALWPSNDTRRAAIALAIVPRLAPTPDAATLADRLRVHRTPDDAVEQLLDAALEAGVLEGSYPIEELVPWVKTFSISRRAEVLSRLRPLMAADQDPDAIVSALVGFECFQSPDDDELEVLTAVLQQTIAPESLAPETIRPLLRHVFHQYRSAVLDAALPVMASDQSLGEWFPVLDLLAGVARAEAVHALDRAGRFGIEQASEDLATLIEGLNQEPRTAILTVLLPRMVRPDSGEDLAGLIAGLLEEQHTALLEIVEESDRWPTRLTLDEVDALLGRLRDDACLVWLERLMPRIDADQPAAAMRTLLKRLTDKPRDGGPSPAARAIALLAENNVLPKEIEPEDFEVLIDGVANDARADLVVALAKRVTGRVTEKALAKVFSKKAMREPDFRFRAIKAMIDARQVNTSTHPDIIDAATEGFTTALAKAIEDSLVEQ